MPRLRLALVVVVCALVSVAGLFPSRGLAADLVPLLNSVQIDGFAVAYPEGWSVLRQGGVTIVVNVPPGEAGKLPPARFLRTPQIRISMEERTSHDEAIRRLEEIGSETDDPVESITVMGRPAIQRRHETPWPTTGNGPAASESGLALTITTAIASDTRLIRLDGSLPAGAPAALAELVATIEKSVTFVSADAAVDGTGARLARMARIARKVLARLWNVEVAYADLLDGEVEDDDELMEGEEEEEEADPPPSGQADPSESTLSSPGVAQRLLNGGTASEMEVAVSANGRNIVVGQQRVWTASNDGGRTWPWFGNFPSTTGGDCSMAWSNNGTGTFYEATINNSSTAINVSTNNGQTFTFRANAFTCGTGQCGFTGGQIPDQEHIAADRNSPAAGDRVYSVFRNGFATPSWGIVCSLDGGNTWSTANVGTAGDFPRVNVGPDGRVYVAYVNGNNLMVDRFPACANTNMMTADAGFPVTVATGVNDLPCPIAGLDRCNNGNTLRSPMVAVDDTNATRLFYTYAQNTAAGNENAIVRASTDSGVTWVQNATLNGAPTGRRYMPWVCTTNGTAFASWYDRRAATAGANDLTDFYGATAGFTGLGGTLAAGTEFQINDPSTADAQCAAGQAAGSAASWPCGSRATGDSETCSAQPQLAGRCTRTPPQAGDSNQACDFTTGPACPNMGETCQTWGGGCPKYGDYNGNACAVGHFLQAWASATPASGGPGIDLFFTIRDTVPPVAKCKDRTVNTDPGKCEASNVSIDDGSNNGGDNDDITTKQEPPGPYPKGTTNVKLTVTDQNGNSASCTANVTVEDHEDPMITCPSSTTAECAGPNGAPVTYAPEASDNCPGVTTTCAPPSGSTFPLGTTTVTCEAKDTSNNTDSCNFDVTVADTTPPTITSVSASPNVLHPPNHKMVPVTVSASATDVCDPNPTCKIDSISSSEAALAKGSGKTSPDYVITGTQSADLRAERTGPGPGRTYTLKDQCSDASGNHVSATTTVKVPHDQGS
jgi:hypothetical protein